jgi:predicted transcriptional regulator
VTTIDCTETRDTVSSSLAAAFLALRVTHDLTVDEIAAIGGVAPSYWRRLEDGSASPSEPWIRSAVDRITTHLHT